MNPVAVAILAAVLAGSVAASPARAQDKPSAPASPAEVSFSLERAGVPVPKYVITVHEDGTGTYAGEEVRTDSVRSISSGGGTPPTSEPQQFAARETFHRVLTLSPSTAQRIFATAHSLKNFNTACASKLKNIADTGAKTLTYQGPAGAGSCSYNYSENKNVVQLTDLFYGIAETMDEGRRLEHLHRYDRLGLDSAIGFLAQEVTDGRALELGTIAGTLQSIASDADLMQRVRLRASKLLSLLPPELQTQTP